MYQVSACSLGMTLKYRSKNAEREIKKVPIVCITSSIINIVHIVAILTRYTSLNIPS